MYHVIQGLLVGIASMAPIGMQNLFIINTALAQPLRRLFLTCMIVAFFDMSLSISAFFGMGALMDAFPTVKIIVLLVGGLIMGYMGYGIFVATPTIETVDTKIPISKIITMAFVVAWGNPQALIDVSMMIGAFRATLNQTEGLQFLLGVLLAALVWFNSLGLTIYKLSQKISISSLVWINRICGSVIVVYAIKLVYEGIKLLVA